VLAIGHAGADTKRLELFVLVEPHASHALYRRERGEERVECRRRGIVRGGCRGWIAPRDGSVRGGRAASPVAARAQLVECALALFGRQALQTFGEPSAAAAAAEAATTAPGPIARAARVVAGCV